MGNFEKQLELIKDYLSKHGINIDLAIRWQGSFKHEALDYGCHIIATCMVDSEEVKYAIPRNVVNLEKKYRPRPYIKMKSLVNMCDSEKLLIEREEKLNRICK